MKKHSRMLKLTIKLMAGHSMMFMDKFADDFAVYRSGSNKFHPVLVDAFKRFESKFGFAFKHRHFIEQNHKLHTGIYGQSLMSMITALAKENGTPRGTFYEGGKKQTFYVTPPVSKTLH